MPAPPGAMDEVGETEGSGQLSSPFHRGQSRWAQEKRQPGPVWRHRQRVLEEGEELDWSDAGDIVKQVTSAASVMEQQDGVRGDEWAVV